MLMIVQYEIQFLSDWHCGSGLSAGAESDAEVIKDENKLPYIPGKTIKGLFKDALMEIQQVQPELIPLEEINNLFGYVVKDQMGKVKETIAGFAFFSNACLGANEKNEITGTLSNFLYKNISSTAIGENGIANDASLRTMEVCIPVCLMGTIDIVDNHNAKQLLEIGAKWIRHLGVNRNRGLGRCSFKILNPINN